MGLILDFGCCPSPGVLFDVSDDGIVSVDRDMLHRNRLLSGSTVPVEAFSKHRDRSLRPVSHLQIAASRFSKVGALNGEVGRLYPRIMEEMTKLKWELMGHGLTNSVLLSGLPKDKEVEVIEGYYYGRIDTPAGLYI